MRPVYAGRSVDDRSERVAVTPRVRLKVEKVVEEMFMVAHGRDPNDPAKGHGLSWEALAAWHLRELARARGTTVANIVINPTSSTRGGNFIQWTRNVPGCDVRARVVLVQKRRTR